MCENYFSWEAKMKKNSHVISILQHPVLKPVSVPDIPAVLKPSSNSGNSSYQLLLVTWLPLSDILLHLHPSHPGNRPQIQAAISRLHLSPLISKLIETEGWHLRVEDTGHLTKKNMARWRRSKRAGKIKKTDKILLMCKEYSGWLEWIFDATGSFH